MDSVKGFDKDPNQCYCQCYFSDWGECKIAKIGFKTLIYPKLCLLCLNYYQNMFKILVNFVQLWTTLCQIAFLIKFLRLAESILKKNFAAVHLQKNKRSFAPAAELISKKKKGFPLL